MGINRRELVDQYYEGKADLFTWPVPPVVGYMDLFIPLEELPESVQELYEYKPEKARQLLAEAGYADGFKTSILVWKPEDVDLLAVVKAYWAKIGVDLQIDVRDFAVFTSMSRKRTYAQ